MVLFLVTWKEFEKSKMIEGAEIVKELDKQTVLTKMREFNSQKRLTTTDYAVYNLTALFEAKGFNIVEKIIEEPIEETEV